jgi:hypothetical protein
MTFFLSTALAGAIALAALLPTQASAGTFQLAVNGDGITADITLTYGSATDAKYPDASIVTGISGTFSDSTLGISDAAIKGLVQVNYAIPDATNLLAPANFSRFPVAEGTSPISNGYMSYDNLLWLNGSPQTASDYPGAGGYLDIYGLLFRIGNGRVVNLWSNGTSPVFGNPPITYGAHVATVDEMLHRDAVVSVSAVPEPATTALLLAGIGIVGAAVRRRAAAAA